MKLRKAATADIAAIQRLVNEFARREEMIPRSLNELYEHVRDFVVCEEHGNICGVSALHVMWDNLAEIRSLAVKKEYQRRGMGAKLVRHCLKEAKALGVKKVFVLTYQKDFFASAGFTEIDKGELPQKIWSDCVRCPKFPECDETAMIRRL